MVNLKPGNEMWKVNWSTCHKRGTEKKIAYEKISRQESKPLPPEHMATALSTELRELMENTCTLTEALFKISGMTPLKPVLLIPCKTEYCVFKTKVDNWPYFPLVCTAKGTYVAALFHGQCAKCKTIWYPSYNIANNHDRRIFTDLSGVDDVGYI